MAQWLSTLPCARLPLAHAAAGLGTKVGLGAGDHRGPWGLVPAFPRLSQALVHTCGDCIHSIDEQRRCQSCVQSSRVIAAAGARGRGSGG